jgi:hypothetical protein
LRYPPEKVRNPREFEEISITDDRKRKRARIKKPAEMCGFFIPDAPKALPEPLPATESLLTLPVPEHREREESA